MMNLDFRTSNRNSILAFPPKWHRSDQVYVTSIQRREFITIVGVKSLLFVEHSKPQSS